MMAPARWLLQNYIRDTNSMEQRSSWMGIDMDPIDTDIVFYIPPSVRDKEKESKYGYQWVGDTKYPDPFSKVLLRRYPDRPFLISFPRSGTHWMMIVLECYFQESIVTEDTPWSDNQRIWPKILVVHDLIDEDYPATNFIVKYRKDPVAAVFSYAYKHVLSSFHPNPLHAHGAKSDWETPEFFMLRARQYAEWLDKYLFRLEPKDSYTYEDMLQDMPSVLRKICSFLDEEFDEESCARVLREVTREKCRELLPTHQMYRVDRYDDLKREFSSRYTDLIWDTVTSPGPHIKRILEGV